MSQSKPVELALLKKLPVEVLLFLDGLTYTAFACVIVKVREAAVDSFHSLSVNSVEFPDEAVCLLMDMLYDDYMVVRLKALEALHHIADMGNLKIQETYMPAVSHHILSAFFFYYRAGGKS